VRAQGIQDSGQAGGFVRGEIKGERDEAGHSAPPEVGQVKGVDTQITGPGDIRASPR
jgi:hypothetical protein